MELLGKANFITALFCFNSYHVFNCLIIHDLSFSYKGVLSEDRPWLPFEVPRMVFFCQ